jgi:hypothetical protein
MISVEGYEPLNAFYTAAKRAFKGPVFREVSRRNAQARDNGEERPFFPWHVFNTELAAQFAVWELVEKRCSESPLRPKLLLPSGAQVTTAPDMFRPLSNVQGKLREALSSIYSERDDSQPFYGLLEAISQTYWVDMMVEELCFQEPANTVFLSKFIGAVQIIDWTSGMLELKSLKRFYSGMDSLRGGAFELKSIGIDLPFGKRFDDVLQNLGHKETLYRPLLPYDGSMIILPCDWLRELEPLASAGSIEFVDSYAGPEDAIFKLWHDGLTKLEIKTLVAQDFKLSSRKFEKYWADAANKNSALSLPGRRKQKS